MANITDQILDQAITFLDAEFDSHDVIKKVMQIAARPYAEDLAKASGDDPFISLHSSIGTRLLGFKSIEPTKKVMSMNVRGQITENQGWRKK